MNMSNHDYKPGDRVEHIPTGAIATIDEIHLKGGIIVPRLSGQVPSYWSISSCRPAPGYRELVEATADLVAHWDTPDWDYRKPHTAGVIAKVRQALSRLDAPEPEPEPRTPTPINKESGEITLKELERVLGVRIENTGRACNGMIMAQFPRLEIKEGAFLSGGCGYADTFEEAVGCYLPDIAGRHIVINSSDLKTRREYILPAKILVGDYFKSEPGYKWLALNAKGDLGVLYDTRPTFDVNYFRPAKDGEELPRVCTIYPPSWLKRYQLWERISRYTEHRDNLNDQAWNGYWWRLAEDHSRLQVGGEVGE